MTAAGRTRLLTHATRAVFLGVSAFTIRHELGILQWDLLPPLLHSFRWTQFALAVGLTLVSFLLLGALELAAIRTVLAGMAWRVPPRDALRSAFMAHAFSQSVGVSPVTGTAVRLAAYRRRGVGSTEVVRITTFVTVGIVAGLLAFGSGALLFGPALPAAVLEVPAGLRGAAMASIVLCYIAWSVMSGNPPFAVVAAQIGITTLDFYLTSTILFVLLPPAAGLSYLPFLRACALAHTLGMLSLIPGGLGVFEATMFGLLAADLAGIGRGALTAALLAYRIVYYVLPLAVASATALVLELRQPHVPDMSTTVPLAPVQLSATGGHNEVSIEWLVDNAEAYGRVFDAIDSARRSIWISQLAFDADCVVYGPDGSRRSIAEALLAAVTRAPVDVRIVLNETFLLDTARPLRRFFAEHLGGPVPGRGTVEIRGVSSFPRLQHTKMLIVDGTDAFLFGSPFVNGYWDDARHQPVDVKRPLRELGGRPLHDLSVRFTGAAVADLERLFAELWTPDAPVPPVAPALPSGVRVVSTSPRGVLRNRPEGSTEILESLLTGIGAARSLIYIEHQYLSSRPIVAALAAALQREPALEIVMVLNENADVTAYRRWQNARLQDSGLARHPRVGVFALWSAARGPQATALNQVFVHSKLVAVDDAWATAGSANLDGVSLHSYGDDFTGVGRRVFRHTRNFDVNIVLEGSFVGDLRSRLWAEHLGLPRASVRDRPAGGWLSLWREQAAGNVAALQGAATGAATQMRGFVLPYSAASTPAGQLADLGVPADPRHLDVRFDPGWLEVHFSPNWVRNMFT